MSRGDRVAVSGNLSTSMRDNYGEHGVEEVCRQGPRSHPPSADIVEHEVLQKSRVAISQPSLSRNPSVSI